MHKNYRRKNPRNPCITPYWLSSANSDWSQWYQRHKAKERRQAERRLIHHEEWDDLPWKYHRTKSWDYW